MLLVVFFECGGDYKQAVTSVRAVAGASVTGWRCQVLLLSFRHVHYGCFFLFTCKQAGDLLSERCRDIVV